MYSDGGCSLTKVTEALHEDLRTFVIYNIPPLLLCDIETDCSVCVISVGGAEGNIKDLDIRIEASKINVMPFCVQDDDHM